VTEGLVEEVKVGSRYHGSTKITRLLSHYFNQKWRTPRHLYIELDAEFHFDFDPCPPDPKFNGVFNEWGKRNFVNPPYGKAIRSWLEKAVAEQEKGNLSVFLLPAYTDVAWFHEVVIPRASEIRFIKGRLNFEDKENCAPFASMIVVFSPSSPSAEDISA
jgi:site-specific DNA-methyltransferase (adenine-specific)